MHFFKRIVLSAAVMFVLNAATVCAYTENDTVEQIFQEYLTQQSDYIEANVLLGRLREKFPDTKYGLYAKAVLVLNESFWKNKAEAIDLFTKAIALDPAFWPAYTYRADVYFSNNENDKAMGDCKTALEHNPDDIFAHIILADVYIQKNDRGSAKKHIDKALKINAFNSQSYALLAKYYWAEDDLEKALANLELAVKYELNNISAKILRGDIYFSLGEYDQALRSYKDVLILSPGNYDILTKRADTFFYLKEYRAAIDDAKYALTLTTAPAPLYGFIGACYWNLEDKDKAVEYYSKAIESAPREADYYNKRSEMYFDMGKYIQAIDDLNQALVLDTEVSALYYANKGIVTFNQKNYEGAIDCFNTALHMKPGFRFARNWRHRASRVRFNAMKADKLTARISAGEKTAEVYGKRAEAFEKAEMYTAAADDYSRIIDELGKNTTDYYLKRITMNRLGKRYDEAIADCMRELELCDDKSYIYNVLGLIYDNKKEYDTATGYYQTAVDLNKDFYYAHFNLASSLQRAKKYDLSIKEWEKCRSLYRKNTHNTVHPIYKLCDLYDEIKDKEGVIKCLDFAQFTLGDRQADEIMKRKQVIWEIEQKRED